MKFVGQKGTRCLDMGTELYGAVFEIKNTESKVDFAMVIQLQDPTHGRGHRTRLHKPKQRETKREGVTLDKRGRGMGNG